MKNCEFNRGYYFQFFKQDSLKKDLWIEDAVVFSRNAYSAAELFVEVHCQLNDYIYSINEVPNKVFELIVKGELNFECKYKIIIHSEYDIEIPAYLRN